MAKSSRNREPVSHDTKRETVQSTVSSAGMRLVKLLVGNQPQTIAELIKETGVTRTAVTEQLNELVAAGFMDRSIERLPGRGRPRHLYGATTAALVLLFANNQGTVVPAIWRAIAEVGGAKLTESVLNHVSASLAEQYIRRMKGATPPQRLREMARLLREEGVLVELEEDGSGRLTLRKRSCPFITMYEEKGTVCCVDQKLMSVVVGAPVVRTACRHEGAACCSFRIAASNGKEHRR